MTTNSPQLSPRPPRPPRSASTRERWKRMPMRNADGSWAATIEFRPASAPLVEERFSELARVLYQRWVVEPPSYARDSAATALAMPSIMSLSALPSLSSESHHV